MEKTIPVPVNAKMTWLRIIRNWQLYVMIAPAIILIFIFSYIPMAGAQIAFRDYNPIGGNDVVDSSGEWFAPHQ